ncbi:NAD(P)H-binding protein [Altererythrobacter salegens]|uniref:NAD(P)H-binding protein n=1 Tax=Croceibacterium salegens TaxID=1737568 RepID=A0A6I4SR99_9SPHN|nr:complex I NDUFA9 subunit family protein [Croceibacterium salegens]MXO57938.1 NAD(P)H-binding protein [Croceibacterium salegens]
MATYGPLEDKLVVLIGGGGFVGRHLAQALLERGARLRIADRHPEKAHSLRPLANLGQIQFARCNVADRRSVEMAMHGANAAVYLVGAFSGDLETLQADAAGWAAEAAARNGAEAFAYVSAIGADPESESGYASTKGRGETLVSKAFPKATIVRPSVMFGEDDAFLNMFAGLISSMPVLPVFGPEAKVQPVWVDDVAEALANALADPAAHGGKTYELAGPEQVTMLELNQRIAAGQARHRSFVPMPDAISGFFAALPMAPMNGDQWRMLKAGNVAGGKLPGLKQLGVQAHPLGLFLDKWMVRFRKHGRFGDARAA